MRGERPGDVPQESEAGSESLHSAGEQSLGAVVQAFHSAFLCAAVVAAAAAFTAWRLPRTNPFGSLK